MNNGKRKIKFLLTVLCVLSVFGVSVFAQNEPPAPTAPKSVKIPPVFEKKLKNGLQTVVIERKNVPLVTIQLLINAGARDEQSAKAGLADLTASLLTKGTPTRTAEEIARQIEFLGASVSAGAGWNNSNITISVMSDKLNQVLEIMSDAVQNPSFKQDEIDLLKSQTLDGLAYNLKQPGFLANYVAAKYSFGEHPTGGTPDSIKAISRNEIAAFHKNCYAPNNAVLIFSGDVSSARANELALKYFGKWNGKFDAVEKRAKAGAMDVPEKKSPANIARRLLVVDLPDSGQAAVAYTKNFNDAGRRNEKIFYPASVLNSVLGGGYSSRLNQEIRIKRGLSYGAGSGFSWRGETSNFATRTQTKNESAAEVASLVLGEVKKLQTGKISAGELGPRKLVLTGNFGRDLETTGGLAGAVAELYTFGLPTTNLNAYMSSIDKVSDADVQRFAAENLSGGDLVIVGDYSKFKEDLKRRFPGMQITVVKASDLDLSSNALTR